MAYGLIWVSAVLFALVLTRQPSITTASDAVGNSFISTYGYTLIGLTCAGIVLLTLDEKSLLSRLFQWKPLSALGLVSYGFYFFHALPYPGFELLATHWPKLRPFIPVVALALTLTLALLSFHFFESPFLRLKNRFAPGHRSIPAGTEEVAVAL